MGKESKQWQWVAEDWKRRCEELEIKLAALELFRDHWLEALKYYRLKHEILSKALQKIAEKNPHLSEFVSKILDK